LRLLRLILAGDEALESSEPLDFVLLARRADEISPLRGDDLEAVLVVLVGGMRVGW